MMCEDPDCEAHKELHNLQREVNELRARLSAWQSECQRLEREIEKLRLTHHDRGMQL